MSSSDLFEVLNEGLSVTAHVSGARVKNARCPARITVRTLNMAGLAGHRTQRREPDGGSGFGETWMQAERKCERRGTGLFPEELPLIRPTTISGEYK